MDWSSGDRRSLRILSDRLLRKRQRAARRSWWLNAILRGWMRCGGTGRFSATAASTRTSRFCAGGWIETEPTRVSHAGRMGAARSHLARLAARALRLARKVFSDSMGVRRYRPPSRARGKGADFSPGPRSGAEGARSARKVWRELERG